MKNAIVGYTGFVGSNLLQFYKFDFFYNSSNFCEAKDKCFDTLFFCGVPAIKWKANKYPQEDIDVIENIKNILKTIKVNKIILISTIDVYENVDLGNDEDYDCDYVINHPYGRNRYMFEYFIREKFDNYNIIRLPALFGKGLKKNIIYDLINNNQIENIEKNTMFQWYDLNWLKKDIDIILQNNIQVCNLFTEPLETIKILELFNYPLDTYKTQSTLKYNSKTKYANLFHSNIDGYIYDKSSVLNSIKEYLNFNNIPKSNLVVSNICIKHISQFQFSCILKLFGIQNVQIAPTTLINTWNDLYDINFDIFHKNNINIYSFQSITYGLLHNIFDIETQETLLTHIKNVIDYGIKHKVKIFVFGCPKNRKIIDIDNNHDNNNHDDNNHDNDETFIDFFRKIGDYIGDNDLHICIENNSQKYGCNYLNTITQIGDIVNKINHKNIKMMIDIGNSLMENDNLNDIYKYTNIIYNIDVARENMIAFTEYSNTHKEFIQILKNINYDKNINLEMVINANNYEDELDILCKSLNNFISCKI
jgi:sugar phosphate isomerase/epimerase